MVPLPSEPDKSTASGSNPVGAWKDGLFSCFRYGLFHPHLCLSCWCHPIAMAQVMTRENFNCLGSPGTVAEVATTFNRVMIIFLLYIFFSLLQSGAPLFGFTSSLPLFAHELVFVTSMVFPNKHCKGCEDCCCSFWCHCCTIAQMMRHTADYDKYDAQCCNDTGFASSSDIE